jgi:hypothetical protein
VFEQKITEGDERGEYSDHNRRNTQEVAHADRLKSEKYPVGEGRGCANEGHEQISTEIERLIKRVNPLPK